MKTIPEIAEVLRVHINADNDAKRLIVEHILPLVGLNFDTLEEAQGLTDHIDELEEALRNARRHTEDLVEDIAKSAASAAFIKTYLN